MEKLDSTTRDLLAECTASTKVLAQTFLQDRFFRKFSSLHDRIFNLIDYKGPRKKAIAAPRGFGKTSICTLARPMRDILFQNCRYIVPISSSATSAIEQSENLKRELESNILVQKLFPKFKSNNWSRDCWDTSTGIRIFPRGASQQIRGRLYRNWRPDRINIDDLEDRELVKNEERRAELFKWLDTDVCNSIDRGSDNWEIVVIGTVLHQDSVLQRLLEDPSWESEKLSLCTPDFKSYWPDLVTDEGIKQMLEEHRRNGIVEEFYMEYMNEIIPGTDAAFRPEFFKNYDEAEVRSKGHRIETVILADPAKTQTAVSCYSAIVAVGFDLTNHCIYVRDLIMARLSPDDFINESIAMAGRFRAKIIGVEVTSLDSFITFPFKKELVRLGSPAQLVELRARGKKEERVAALIPWYRQGIVYHNAAVCQPLEQQLLSYPRSRYLDAADAFAYIVPLLDEGHRYFVGLEDPTEEFMEAEYAELERDDFDEDLDYNIDEIQDNWAII